MAEILVDVLNRNFSEDAKIFYSARSLLPSDKWIERVKEELVASDIVFSLLTHTSVVRPWVIAEAGVAWASDKLHFIISSTHIRVDDIPPFISTKQIAYPERDNDFLEPIFKAIGNKLGVRIRLDEKSRIEHGRAIAALLARRDGPTEAVEAWNLALRLGDVDKARALTSSNSFDYIASKWGSLEKLSEKYQSGDVSDVETVTLSVAYSENRTHAVVKYRSFYADNAFSVRDWEDLLIIEDGEWKVAPQYVVVADLTDVSRVKAAGKQTAQKLRRRAK